MLMNVCLRSCAAYVGRLSTRSRLWQQTRPPRRWSEVPPAAREPPVARPPGPSVSFPAVLSPAAPSDFTAQVI